MELWVRSQDREHLMKTTDIDISCDDKTIILINNYEMAKYKTRERALEVLDEIQDILKPRMVLTKLGDIVAKTYDGTIYSKPNEYDIKEMSTYVYEMPIE